MASMREFGLLTVLMSLYVHVYLVFQLKHLDFRHIKVHFCCNFLVLI